MSDKLPFPRDPAEGGERLSLMDVVALLRLAFFPTRGARQGVMERLAALEERVTKLESGP